MSQTFTIEGQVVDLLKEEIFPGRVMVRDGIVSSVEEISSAPSRLLLPGFIDAHVHVESSLLTPREFARLSLVQGTVGSVSDPHEIANVLGATGVHYMIANGKDVPFYFAWGAPSCVPATTFETAGGELDAAAVKQLLMLDEVYYLSEVMNVPAVLANDPQMRAKIAAAEQLGKPIDGHAPTLVGQDLDTYIAAGVSTDHESVTIDEAREKLEKGMKILIREGSAARQFDEMIPLLKDFPQDIMFCTDDMHPSYLVQGHINKLVERSIAFGIPPMSAFKAACLNPRIHYNLKAGMLRVGDSADFIAVAGEDDMAVEVTFVRGIKVAEEGKSLLSYQASTPVNNFKRLPISEADIQLAAGIGKLQAIRVLDGQLVTERVIVGAAVEGGLVQSDVERDLLKLVVINRYDSSAEVAVSFVEGFGLKSGALAGSVAHDSHNIVAVGVSDRDIVSAVNEVIATEGGLAVVEGKEKLYLPLRVAGLMSEGDGFEVAKLDQELNVAAKELGAKLQSPFTTLSFLALLVIPALKLSDKGLFDGETFTFTSPFVIEDFN